MALVARFCKPAPAISIGRDEYLAALDRLHPLLDVPEAEREHCWQRFAWIRVGVRPGPAGPGRAHPGVGGRAGPPTGRPRRGDPGDPRNRTIAIDWTVHRPGSA